ncbi:MAG TPA: choice-of-anchor A family protein [Nocardioides sp.]|uniref:choice-of-anchor A family protein n=1 Tax=Nocardioides sp. TaxID=35761 RepID=UPI002E37BEC2|nr:choice-of-anchor A family protein [Nocardioides sp.]HEX5086745.1 choice-of-anchor A family protein [Nocardioides sp.]
MATSAALAAPDACPPSWPALHAGPPSGSFDGNVSVLAGGSLLVSGGAAGAEGTVVALGDATFARDEPGSYEVGATALGSQVTPYADSDMLVVGGNLTGAAGTHVDVGQSLGGDVVVGGSVAPGTDIDPHGGRVDTGVAGATTPYLDLAGQLAGKSSTYAAMAPTGQVEVKDDQLLLTGDGVSTTQVFTLDASALGGTPEAGRVDLPSTTGQVDSQWQGNTTGGGRHGSRGHQANHASHADHASQANKDGEEQAGRSLQLVGVPDGATVIVNITGSDVALDIDSLLAADGSTIDPLNDPAFGGLATHMLWNLPAANTVNVTGAAQLPGSLLVPTASSTTTISNQGTNGRVLVGGSLVHTGAGEMHAYPFLADDQLTCAGDPVHVTSLTLDVELVDPDHVVDPDRVFEGLYDCTLLGVNVTPADNTWRMRAGSGPKTISDQIPSGATCTVSERLDRAPAPFRSWADTSIAPDVVVVAKRELRGFVVTNKVKALPPAPTGSPTLQPAQQPSSSPTETETVPPPPPPPTATESSSPTPASLPEPTNRPTDAPSPTTLPTQTPAATPTATAGTEAPHADAPKPSGPAGPLTTTAPFTLRGAFVWGPLLMLSLLTLVLRIRRRPTRMH